MEDDKATIFSPNFDLKKKLGDDKIERLISPAKVKKAKAIIEDGKKTFGPEVLEDVELLKNNFYEYMADLAGEKESAAFIKMVDLALNIKSCSTIYGYDLATSVAKSLFEFLTIYKSTGLSDFRTLHVHIDALQTIFSKNITGEGGKLGKELLAELETLANLHSTRQRPKL